MAQRAPAPAPDRQPGGGGAALVVGGALIFLYVNDALAPARDIVLPVLVILVAAAIILAPWWIRLVRGLADERAERIRSQERADVAAHLHDSVLQTLALVQKRADDPREVAALARRQERELRAWLNNTPARGGLPGRRAGSGGGRGGSRPPRADRGRDRRRRAARGAGRRAGGRGAGGAGERVQVRGPEPIALYAEVTDDRVEVFVRDRGPGFAVDDVPNDRRGVRDSIVGRMERHGGRATVHSTPGHGTEVELVIEP